MVLTLPWDEYSTFPETSPLSRSPTRRESGTGLSGYVALEHMQRTQSLTFRHHIQVGAILCAVTLAINIVYVFVERSLPKEARIVTGLQVARRSRRHALPAEKEKRDSSSESSDIVADFQPLTPFSKDHFKFIAISIKAIPAAFCEFPTRNLINLHRSINPNSFTFAFARVYRGFSAFTSRRRWCLQLELVGGQCSVVTLKKEMNAYAILFDNAMCP
jgi:hypothetical protein